MGERGGVEMWRSAEAGFRKGRRKDAGERRQETKEADGRGGMGDFHLKARKANSLLHGRMDGWFTGCFCTIRGFGFKGYEMKMV